MESGLQNKEMLRGERSSALDEDGVFLVEEHRPPLVVAAGPGP